MNSLTKDAQKAAERVGLLSDKIIINGGKPLMGRVDVRGAKNLATKAMVAALLADTPSILRDVPAISDVGVVTGMLGAYGVTVTSLGEGDVTRIESLIAAAAGIDEMRGDRLEVSRLGRGEGFSARRIEIDEAATAGESAPVRIGFDVAALPALPKILFFVVLGLLLGVIVAFAMQKKPAALSPTEREAVLGKMRAWLAEGNLAEGGSNEGSRPR